MYILAIETSCDETSASVVNANPKSQQLEVLSNIVSSQINIHKKYGGVVPEIAAREHVLSILPVINEALLKAKKNHKQIDYLAVTKGPGLSVALLSGVETVRTLAYVWNKAVVGVNHIAGHLYANFLDRKEKIILPAIILTVSGGHTNLVLMKNVNKIKIVGETLDDAAGEAYDKGAKMMGLPYPGGPVIDRLAKEYIIKHGRKSNLEFPRPLLQQNNLNFSFSGLKTALLYALKNDKNWQQRILEYAYAYQEAIINVLIKKSIRATKQYNVKTLMLSGGVSANSELRTRLKKELASTLPKVKYLVPDRPYTTDNAAMIAAAAFFEIQKNLQKNKKMTYNQLRVDPALSL